MAYVNYGRLLDLSWVSESRPFT
ncbi:uncharacterized protein G2W53_002741 [Senna tora]|uniref:Uncharacterized protein n=1 Tax=Senna tora TaxID=362788 RepID=A0A834X7T4_9FABA|nr:uncharacterized protein G2W53_002741 [Senna tora]